MAKGTHEKCYNENFLPAVPTMCWQLTDNWDFSSKTSNTKRGVQLSLEAQVYGHAQQLIITSIDPDINGDGF